MRWRKSGQYGQKKTRGMRCSGNQVKKVFQEGESQMLPVSQIRLKLIDPWG